MKWKFLLGSACAVLFLALFFLGANPAEANSCVSNVSSGNFNSSSSWSACGGLAPQAADTVTILNANTITLTATATVAGININSGGVLAGGLFNITDTGNYIDNGTHSGSNGGLTISGASSAISGAGNITNTGTSTISGATAPTFTSTSSLTFSGNMLLSGPVSITAGGVVNVAASTTIASGNTVTNNGTFNSTGTGSIVGGGTTSTWINASNSILNFAGSTTGLLLQGVLVATSTGNTVNYNGAAQTCKNSQYYNLTFGGSGTKTCTSFTSPILGNLSMTGSAAWTLGAILAISGNMTVSSTANLTGGTFLFTLTGNLLMAGGTFTTGNATATFSGTTEISGGTLALSNNAAKFFVGLVTVDGGTMNGASTGINFQKGINESSGSIAITGTASFNTNAQTLSGTMSITTVTIASSTTLSSTSTVTMTTPTVAAGATLTNNGVLTVSGVFTVTGSVTNNATTTANSTLTGAGSWTQGASSTLNCAGATTNAMGVVTHDFHTNAGNTVNYTGGTQTLASTTYQNLTISATGTKTATNLTTVSGNLVVSSGTVTLPLTSLGGTMFISGGAVTLGGTLTVNATTTVSGGTLTTGAFVFTVAANLVVSGGTFTIGGAATSTVTGTTEVSAGTLTVSNSAGLKTFQGLVKVDGGTLSGASTAFVFQNGITETSGTVSITGTATFNTNTQALNGGAMTIAAITLATSTTLTNSSTLTGSGTFGISGTFLNNASVAYSGTTINISSTGTWTQGASSSLEMSGNITITNSGTFDAHSNNNLVTYDRANNQTCLVTGYYNLTFGGGGTKTCTASSTLGNLIFNVPAGTWTLTAALNIGGTLTVSNGTTTTGGVAFTVASTTEINGGNLVLTNNAGTKTFTGLITVDSGSLTGASNAIVTSAGIINNAGVVAITGVDTISTFGAMFDGTNTISIATTTVNNPGTVLNQGTVTLTGVLGGSGAWTQGVGGILNDSATSSAITVNSFDASSNIPNTVNYNGAVQTCRAVQYDFLTLSGSGTKTCIPTSNVLGDLTYNVSGTWTLGAALTVNGNFTITTGTVDVSTNNYPVTLNGNVTNSGTFNTESDTVTFGGSNEQVVSGTFVGASDFFNLTIANSFSAPPRDCELTNFTPSVAFENNLSVANNYTITTGGVGVQYDDGSTYTFNNIDWVGPSGNPIYFRDSLANAGTWALDVTGTETPLSYVNVSHSDASGGNSISAGSVTNRDCASNVNWSFGATYTSPTVYTQAAYGWFANQNSADVGAPLASQNTTTTLTSTGEAFRLRMLLAVDATDSVSGVDSFVLQYANKGSGTDCSAPQFAYVNVTTSTIIAYNTNPSVADNTPLISDMNDPVDGGRVPVEETYQSAGTFNAPTTIPAGDDGNWDFSLIDNGSPGGVDYCFQAVFSSSTSLYGYTVYPEITTFGVSPPVASNIVLNSSTNITLLPNATATITVVASTSDPAGVGNISFATSTIFRTSLGNTCVPNNLNCYQIPSSSCVFSNSTTTVSCSANIWYFAQSTGNPSSSYPSDSWTGTITVTDFSGNAGIASSSPVNVNVLTAINIAPSSINYGTLNASSTSNTTDQTTTIQNVGNSSTTIQISGTAFSNGANFFATSSQHYATTSFTFGGAESVLSDSATTIPGFTLTTPTTTTPVQGNLFWGIQVPAGNPIGTYNATTTFTPIFTP